MSRRPVYFHESTFTELQLEKFGITLQSCVGFYSHVSPNLSFSNLTPSPSPQPPPHSQPQPPSPPSSPSHTTLTHHTLFTHLIHLTNLIHQLRPLHTNHERDKLMLNQRGNPQRRAIIAQAHANKFIDNFRPKLFVNRAITKITTPGSSRNRTNTGVLASHNYLCFIAAEF